MNKILLAALVSLTLATSTQAKVYCWSEGSAQVCGTEAEYNAYQTSISPNILGFWGVMTKRRTPEERAEIHRVAVEGKKIQAIYEKVAKERQEYLAKKAARLGLMSDSPEDVAETKRIMAAIKKKYPMPRSKIDDEMDALYKQRGEEMVGMLKTIFNRD